MNKIAKIIIAVVVCYLAYFIYGIVRYSHSSDWETCKQYTWVFKDFDVKNFKGPNECFVCSSYIKKRDIHNVFHYYLGGDMYPVVIWEFKDLSSVNLNKVVVNQDVDFSNIKFRSGETLYSDSSSPVTINYGFAFNNGLNINLDSHSKIDGTFEGSNYKGFYGAINKMSFSDEKGKHQIIFDYTPKPYKSSFSPTVFLVYKGHQSFYVIIINSKKPFKDASIINILNLK
jgi:hypothetical protein